MKILLLGVKDEDGAGIVTKNIYEYFLQEGHEAALIVQKSKSNDGSVIAMQRTIGKSRFRVFIDHVQQKLSRVYRRIVPFEVDEKYSFHNLHEKDTPFTAKQILDRAPFKPDVILFFWVTGFINSKMMKDFSELSGAGLYWVGTDNAPFTGGCHYPWKCEGFHTDCSDCPAIITPAKKMLHKKTLRLKKNFYHPVFN